MDDESPASDLPPVVPDIPPVQDAPTIAERTVAALEVLICSDYVTQFALGATFAAVGFRPQAPDGTLNIGFVVALSLTDAVFLIGLIVTFLLAHHERPRDVFLGARPVAGEIRAGIPLTFAALGIAVAVLLGLRAAAPWLRTVEHNPLQDLMDTPLNAALFAVVVVVAGGVREELQRAFLLHRFERWLGGSAVGVVATSVAFGIGHIVQGGDAVVATALLGGFWALIYLRRRSAIAPIVSHAGFDLLQVAQFMVFGR